MDYIPRKRLKTDLQSGSEQILKPVIKELIRTKVHPAVLELLVDKILVVPNTKGMGRNTEAFRIWLSDGQKCIQAVLKRNIHPFLTHGDIREGSYIHVTKYKLARSARLNGDGTIKYLRICNLEATGVDGRSPRKLCINSFQVLKSRKNEETADTVGNETASSDDASFLSVRLDPNQEDVVIENETPEEDAVDLLQWYDNPTEEQAPFITPMKSTAYESSSRKRKLDSPLQYLSPNVFSSPPKSPRLSQTQDSPSRREKAPSTKVLHPITRPLKITPLAYITGPHSTRNKVLDVFALVASVTPALVKCPGIRPGIHYKRELRITDPSTPKKAMLSVFVDPEDFQPEVGTVALFRSVTTNKWDGGSLNAFKRDCEGREWFLENPWGVEGCDVRGLREWWDREREKEDRSEGM